MSIEYYSLNSAEELLQAYTTMFLLLGSAVTSSPSEGGLPLFCENGLLRNLPVESNNKTFLEAARLLKSPCPFSGRCAGIAAGNYDALFLSDSFSHAIPVASQWLDGSNVNTDYYKKVTGLYTRYGFDRSECCDLEYDHLGIELLFVNMLIEKYLTEDDTDSRKEISKDLSAFITTAMLSWLPRWSEAVTNHSLTKCYTGIAGVVVGSLEDVKDILIIADNQKFGL